jgi:glycosyltransferase involved in cell wall biosynthesis
MRILSRRLPISLVVPAYNAETFIRAALASVIDQSHVPAEIIVVDDGSSDRTGDAAAEFGARVIRLPFNLGPAAARNVGAFAAHQPWLAFLDADDVWRNGKLAIQWEALTRWPGVGFCFTDYDVVAAEGASYSCEMSGDAGYSLAAPCAYSGSAVLFGRGALAEPLSRSMFIRQSSALVRRSLFIKSGGYDEGLRLSEDYDLFLRLAGDASAVAIERPLVVYHRRKRSLSVDPLAEISAIDRMWSAILTRSARYPAGIVQVIELRRPATLLKGSRIALRLGRFAEVIAFARRAATARRSLAALLLFGVAHALNNAAGRHCFRGLRSIWRARPVLGPSWLGRLGDAASHSTVQRAHVVGRH